MIRQAAIDIYYYYYCYCFRNNNNKNNNQKNWDINKQIMNSNSRNKYKNLNSRWNNKRKLKKQQFFDYMEKYKARVIFIVMKIVLIRK